MLSTNANFQALLQTSPKGGRGSSKGNPPCFMAFARRGSCARPSFRLGHLASMRKTSLVSDSNPIDTHQNDVMKLPRLQLVTSCLKVLGDTKVDFFRQQISCAASSATFLTYVVTLPVTIEDIHVDMDV